MKTRILALIMLLSISGTAIAQNAPIDFEAGGYGADWTWTTFENGGNAPFEIVTNPSVTGVNTSATVGSMTTLTTGAPWAGVESQHSSDIGSFSFDVTNSTVKIMVYKSVISDVGLKFVEANGEAQPELKVANTLINEWEELTFDFSSRIGVGATGILDQIVIFPDFDLGGRTTDNLCYIDNISFSAQVLPAVPVAPAPIPTVPAENVISVFSDPYTNIAGTNFNPGWGQATVVTEVEIEGNNTLLYSGLNYQGIVLGSNQNVSGMDLLHVDFWSANSTALNVFLISPGPVETPYALPVSPETWVSVQIPLTAFAPVDLSDVFQFKFEGNGDVYLDNLYFYSTTTGVDNNLLPENIVLKQNYPNPFNPATTLQYSLNKSGHVVLKLYNINGQELVTLVDKMAGSGEYNYYFDASGVAAGTYFYSLTAGNQSIVKKMVLIK